MRDRATHLSDGRPDCAMRSSLWQANPSARPSHPRTPDRASVAKISLGPRPPPSQTNSQAPPTKLTEQIANKRRTPADAVANAPHSQLTGELSLKNFLPHRSGARGANE